MTRLEELPGRIDTLTSQILQLRTETKSEFSAMRGEMQSELSAVRGEMQSLGAQMRMLHEDLVSRIAVIGEGRNEPPKRPGKK